MPRDNIYYKDWTAANGWRYRLEILPANTYNPLGSSFLPATTGIPAFGAAPSGGSVYIKLGDNVFTTTTVTEAGYDGLPLGLPASPTMKVGINLSSLNAAGHSDLIGYLLAPIVPVAGQNLYAGTVYSYQQYDLSNTFTLLTDRGNPGDPVDKVEFMGCQQSPITTMLDVYAAEPGSVLNVECIHIARVAMELVPIAAVAELAISNVIGATAAFGPTGILYEYLYSDGTYNYGRAHAKYKDDDGVFDKVYLFKVSDLQTACQSLMENVFHACQRLHPTVAATSSAGFYSGYILDPSWDPSLKIGSPLDLTQFFKQNYLSNGARGSSLFCGDNGDTNMGNLVYFPALVWHSDKTNPTAATAFANCFTGFLHESGGDESIYAFPTLYDFQSKWAIGSWCKGQYSMPDRYTLKVHYNPLETRLGAFYQIPQSGVIKESDGGKEATVEIGGESITGTNISWSGGGDLDNAQYDYKARGTKADQESSLEVIFSNHPTAGSGANRFQMSGDSSDRGYNPDITGPFVIGASTSTPLRTLFYIDTPSMSGGPIALKVHDQCTLLPGTLGGSSVADGEASAMPTDTSDVFDIAADFDGKFWNNMVAHIRRAQVRSCLPFSIAKHTSAVFGNRRQVKYSLTVKLIYGGLETLGDQVELLDVNGSNAGGNAFLKVGTYLGSLPGDPYILSVAPDYAAGVSKISLLAPQLS